MTTPPLIRDMALVERPRERLGTLGPAALKSEELLAIVLRTGYREVGVMALATQLLATHSLSTLLCMPYSQLASIRGIGPSRAAVMVAAQELIRRIDGCSDGGQPAIQSTTDVLAHTEDIRGMKKEYLIALFLNARHRLITKEVISIGTLTASLAHPREIFAPAIGKAAAGVILVHNHPSGDPSPSEEDVRLTRRIAQAGHIMGIDLLDHIIVTTDNFYSFRTQGRL